MKKLDTRFAIIDVQRGRKKLSAAIAEGKRFKAVIEVGLDTQHSRDDGTSIEFSGGVISARYEEIKTGESK